jgi:hypothetical protein
MYHKRPAEGRNIFRKDKMPERRRRRTLLIAGLDTSNISRRYDTTRQKLKADRKLAYTKDLVEKKYRAEIAESQNRRRDPDSFDPEGGPRRCTFESATTTTSHGPSYDLFTTIAIKRHRRLGSSHNPPY